MSSPRPGTSAYIGQDSAQCVFNYRVRDLDAMLAQLRAAGAAVEDRVDEYDYGRFGWGQRSRGKPF